MHPLNVIKQYFYIHFNGNTLTCMIITRQTCVIINYNRKPGDWKEETEVNDLGYWQRGRSRDQKDREVKPSSFKNNENLINVEILQGSVTSLSLHGKKAAHCCGKRRMWKKKAIVSADPFDSSTDKSHILEAVQEEEEEEEEVRSGHAAVIWWLGVKWNSAWWGKGRKKNGEVRQKKGGCMEVGTGEEGDKMKREWWGIGGAQSGAREKRDCMQREGRGAGKENVQKERELLA